MTTNEEVKQKFEECKEATEQIHEILDRITMIQVYEHYETDNIIPSWYATHKWLVKIKRKNVYLVLFQAANNLMKIEAFKLKRGEKFNLPEDKMKYFDFEKFVVNEFPDYMRAEKLEDRIKTLSSIL